MCIPLVLYLNKSAATKTSFKCVENILAKIAITFESTSQPNGRGIPEKWKFCSTLVQNVLRYLGYNLKQQIRQKLEEITDRKLAQIDCGRIFAVGKNWCSSSLTPLSEKGREVGYAINS